MNDSVFFQHILNNNITAIEQLITSSLTQDEYSLALVEAVRYNKIEVVKMLLPLADATYRESDTLQWAAYQGHMDLVVLLLPHSNPKDAQSMPLQLACVSEHQEIFDMLYPLSDPEEALQALEEFNSPREMLIQRMTVDKEKKQLEEAVQGQHKISAKSKM